MGCHSWFYVHLPEKKEEIEQYFRDDIKRNYQHAIKNNKTGLYNFDSLSISELFDQFYMLDSLYFLSHDGKLYIEACDGKTLGIEPMHDMFRIYNYAAEPCHSIEEVLQRCEENNVKLTKEQSKELNNWFSKYPDTIITFG